MIQTILLLLNAFVAFALVLVILLQRQEAGAGGIMGGANLGATPPMRNPLARVTAILAAIFMANCVVLAVLSMGQGRSQSLLDLQTLPQGGVIENTMALPALPELPSDRKAEVPTEVPADVPAGMAPVVEPVAE